LVLKILNTLFKITVSVGLIVFLVMRIGMDEILSSLGKTNPLWLLGAIILITASYWLGSVQWALLLKGEEIHLPYRMTLEYYYVGLFFNNFLPSQLGGDMFRMFDIRRTTSDTAAAISTVFLDRVFGLLLMSGLAIFSAPFIIVRHHLNSQFGVFILFLIAGWTLLLFFLFSKRAARPMAWVFEKIVSRRFHIRCRQIYEKIYLFGRKKKLLISVLMISLIVQAARILTHYLLCRALGLSTPVTYFFLFIPAVAILASLPVSIGGLGIREQTAVILFASAGMAGGDATVMEFLAYLVGILTSLPGGLIFALRRRIIPVKDVLSEDSISGNC
jgi:uncharacterized protein (TIRG00374 family)